MHAAAGEARVGVAHGQMTKEELEQVMEEFAAGELDVLVATTIIESGIDNPHTATRSSSRTPSVWASPRCTS